VPPDLENLREESENLRSRLERLRQSNDAFPGKKEAAWLEGMMRSSLPALDNHIRELEKLSYTGIVGEKRLKQ
jgi:hypothetical protein